MQPQLPCQLAQCLIAEEWGQPQAYRKLHFTPSGDVAAGHVVPPFPSSLLQPSQTPSSFAHESNCRLSACTKAQLVRQPSVDCSSGRGGRLESCVSTRQVAWQPG